MDNVTRDAGGQADEQTRNSWSASGRRTAENRSDIVVPKRNKEIKQYIILFLIMFYHRSL